ncbi:hypothetical protein BBJ29_001180 [Phytophthora kernoviae]|uniref:3-dehydroquinate dehydratase n=1 Tax=Phytophthora kernoviae TaxID=325452 RepID=A0A421FGJ2_9STRA|nr:hypothetical protein BBJ29_001180 [Phytophthora kernoviae]
MNKIDAHVKHYGKGKTRETRCAHCDRLFASRSKDRWRQHMRGCSRVPLEDRQYFTNIERRAFGRGEVSKADLLSEVQTLATEAEVSLSTHESNHEGTILDWLLNARENEIIVLCWVGPLSDSPMIVRALELVKNPVIVVSTKGVEHGALPSTVVGVMSGFGLQSIELALIAAKNISSTQQ